MRNRSNDLPPNLAALEWLKKEWPLFQKNEIWKRKTSGGRTFIGYAGETRGIRFALFAVIGVRSGISELVFVWDPSKPTPIDQVILADITNEGDGYFLDTRLARQAVHSGQDPVHTCKRCLESAVERIIRNPGQLLRVDRKTQAAPAISVGLPSLGKRHR